MPRPIDELVAAAINTVLEQTERLPEARGLVITAPSGAGKSTLLRRLIRKHPRLGTEADSACRIISVTTPGACTLKDLGRKVAAAAGYPIQSASEAGVIWEKARKACRVAGVSFLFLDEIQNVTGTARKGEDIKIRDTLKSLLIDPEWKIGLILSGQPQVVEFLEADVQVSRRLTFVSLDGAGMETPALLSWAMRQMAEDVGLTLEADLASWLVPRMAHAALNQFGTAIENMGRVIEIAIDDDRALGKLTPDHFAREFAIRTGNASFANPFISADWKALDCSRRNINNPEQLITGSHPPSARKRLERRQ